MITADSFGAECPSNWEEIATAMNEIITERGIENNRDALDELWKTYWSDGIPGVPAAVIDD